MHLHLRCLPQRILPPINTPNDKKTKFPQQSLKRLESWRCCSTSSLTCYLRKIRHSVPACGGRIDITSVNVSVLVPSKKSRPYNNHGYSRGCFALLCFAQGAFQLGNRRFFSVHAASFTFKLFIPSLLKVDFILVQVKLLRQWSKRRVS